MAKNVFFEALGTPEEGTKAKADIVLIKQDVPTGMESMTPADQGV